MQLNWTAGNNDFYSCRLANDLKAELYYSNYNRNWNCNLYYIECPIAFESFEENCKTLEQAKEFAFVFLKYEVSRFAFSCNQALANFKLES